MPQFNPKFLVISLGNPGKYAETLHSTGHLALVSLQKALVAGAASGLYHQPPFAKLPSQGKRIPSCQGSVGDKYVLMQSPTLMNVSGRFVASRYAQALRRRELRPDELMLVVLHDELEEKFGVVKTRTWTKSHRGHNGVKSINAVMSANAWPGARWARIGVGIDRPPSREPNDVADYVLFPLLNHQKDIIDAEVGLKVLACLEQLEQDWKNDFYEKMPESQQPPFNKPKEW